LPITNLNQQKNEQNTANIIDKPDLLSNEYRLRFTKLEQYRNNVWKILCADFFSKYIPKDASVLDLGAGWGEFINNIDAKTKIAMDLNKDTQRHLDKDVKLVHQDCATEWQVESDSIDVVFTSNFFEHLPDKASVDYTVAESLRCLKKGGKLIYLGPNIKYVQGAYWDFWDHHIPITECSAMEMLKIVGFEIGTCIPRFLPYSMSNDKNPPLFTVQLYLKLPFIWPLFGKQFLIIAKKPS